MVIQPLTGIASALPTVPPKQRFASEAYRADSQSAG
jgi:hypothetical protein